jgi:hypothetical protein
MKVEIHLLNHSQPITTHYAVKAYTQGPLYCVVKKDFRVFKIPIDQVLCITETPDE